MKMTLDRLKELLAGEPPYRVRQGAQAIFKTGVKSFAEITWFPAALRKRLSDTSILCFEPERVVVSKDGRAHKALLRLHDERRIESVLMSPKPGLWSVCVSSQVGCALKCSFCATGLMGFSRNLTSEEITDQVLFWRQFRPIDNVVYMGMGEPFLNIENVFASLRRLSDPEQFGIGARHLSVSTVGIAPGIESFAENFSQVNLALSLHSAISQRRLRLVPIEKAYSLSRLQAELRRYLKVNRRKVFIEYVLLDGDNDRPEDAEALVQFLARVGTRGLLHVNLIVWNPTETAHRPSSSSSVKRFVSILKRHGIPVTLRKNLGQDIEGACGQLVTG